jgi:hypothetical protein
MLEFPGERQIFLVKKYSTPSDFKLAIARLAGFVEKRLGKWSSSLI